MEKKWDNVLESDFENADFKWFKNAQLNITENIFERNLSERGDKTAIIGSQMILKSHRYIYHTKNFTSKHVLFLMLLEVKELKRRQSNYLHANGSRGSYCHACLCKSGCSSLVVFAGFSAASLADRINDCEAKMVLTSDGNFRGNKTIPVKDVVDEALEKCSSIESVIVLERTKQNINMEDGRDFWWHECIRMS